MHRHTDTDREHPAAAFFQPLRAATWAGPAALLLLSGCGEPEGFSHTVRPLVGDPPQFDQTTAERLDLRRPAASAPLPASAGAPVAFDVPEGWQQLPPTQFRNPNFRVPGDPPAECYLSQLPGVAGGLEQNVNRWLVQQMGQPALDAAGVAALPTRAFFGGQASLIDITGSFSGMASGPQPDYRMLGLLLCAPTGSHFLKFVGPSAAVEAAVPGFFELADSLRFESPDAATETQAVPVTSATPQGDLGFIAPPDWERAGDRPMRAVNFEVAHPAGGASTEAYVSVLGGDGGGVLANFDRWRTQMGNIELTTAEFEALERLPMFGVEGRMIQIQGPFSGMGGETIDAAMLVGAIALLEDQAIFVKLIGPADVAAGQLDSFRAFCSSLRF